MSWDENKYDEMQERLHLGYPEMFKDSYGGVCTGAGWWPIIEILCKNIQAHIDYTNERREALLKENKWNHKIPDEVRQVRIAQIKEKFGGLRFYYEGGDEYIAGLVRMAESWAAMTCEDCGNPGTHRSGGWMRTLCDRHEEDRQAQMKERFGE